MSKKYCINCGTLVPFSAKFCSSCGAPQQGPESKNFRANAPVVALNAGAIAMQDSTAKNSKHHDKSEEKEKYKDIPETKLCKNAKWAFLLDYFSKTAIIPGLLLFGLIVQPIVTIAAFVVYMVILYISAVIVYENFTYFTDEIGFQKSYGAVHKKQVSIPYQMIQNVNISRTLIDRMFGLCHVSIETAGNSAGTKTSVTSSTITSSEGYLPGLDLEQAKNLHDILLSRSQD